MKHKTIKDLSLALKEAGLACSRETIHRRIRLGFLTPRKLPQTNFPDWNIFTNQDLKEIVKAYSAGGRGEWHYVKEQ